LKINSDAGIIKKTLSVCPVCLKRIDADIVRCGDEYFMDKRCDVHGAFSTVVWRGNNTDFKIWDQYTVPQEMHIPECPTGCGLCFGHRQKTCCALVEITHRCNLQCPICFAEASGRGATEPSLDELYKIFKNLVSGGNTFVQLSGGEPTVRDDLPDIIAAAKEAGCDTIQLNSNGIRLGADPDFTKKLKKAGLSFVFMQFDGTDDAIYKKLRGAKLFDAKCAAIRVCGKNLLGITLVPTIVPRVNDFNIGSIIKFGLKHSPSVRGVHFQPISYFGRYPNTPSNRDRITLPEILCAIERQTKGDFAIHDFVSSACDHPRCGFHGDFAVLPEMQVMKLTQQRVSSCCDTPDAHIRNRNFVARRWKRPDETDENTDMDMGIDMGIEMDYRDMNTFLNRVKTHGFTISAMAFQDAYNLDIERLRQCSLHVAHDGKIVPFCAQYLTAAVL